jgi:uncharacterized Zn-binding protein involved in type VI secretion
MNKAVLRNADVEADSHPGECGSIHSGTVEGDSSVSINGTAVACLNTFSMEFDSHGHSTDAEGNCISYSTHSLQPEKVSSCVSINGESVYIDALSVATDPGSGGDVDFVNSGGNDSVRL